MKFVSSFEIPNPDEFDEIRIARQLGFLPKDQIDRLVRSIQNVVGSMETLRDNFQSNVAECKSIFLDRIMILGAVTGLVFSFLSMAAYRIKDFDFYLGITAFTFLGLAILTGVILTNGYLKHL